MSRMNLSRQVGHVSDCI